MVLSSVVALWPLICGLRGLHRKELFFSPCCSVPCLVTTMWLKNLLVLPLPCVLMGPDPGLPGSGGWMGRRAGLGLHKVVHEGPRNQAATVTGRSGTINLNLWGGVSGTAVGLRCVPDIDVGVGGARWVFNSHRCCGWGWGA